MPAPLTLNKIPLLPLRAAVIVSLHACFASCRAIRLLVHLLPLRFARRRRPTPAGDLAAGRWTKLPRHLAVRLAPSGFRWTLWRRGQDKELHVKVEQVQRLAGWCSELGMQSLTVYDETGLLLRQADNVAEALGFQVAPASFKVAMQGLVVLQPPEAVALEGEKAPIRDERKPDLAAALEDEGSASSATLVDSPPPSTLSSSFTVNLISRSAGRPALATLAQVVAAGRAYSKTTTALTSEAVSEIVDALPLPEPDLLFVFGGPYLRLQGFPPWQIRLSEMYHHSSPSWLPPPLLTYDLFRPALDVYGRAEMRLGR
ncbi:hypothetical protein JCM11641_003536 [Rhodosporidiobolus odoratus]